MVATKGSVHALVCSFLLLAQSTPLLGSEDPPPQYVGVILADIAAAREQLARHTEQTTHQIQNQNINIAPASPCSMRRTCTYAVITVAGAGVLYLALWWLPEQHRQRYGSRY